MAFSEYKNLALVLKEFQIQYKEDSFGEWQQQTLPAQLKEEITFNLLELAYEGSEAIVCETLIFPILKEVWKPFRKDLMLWSHQPFTLNESLSGTPDYLFAKQSELGKIVMDRPFVAIVEAKKDDFSSGWGQCSAEMYAAQQLNNDPNLMLFGIVSNGKYWEFAHLQHKIFTKYKETFDINDLDNLYSILFYILGICQAQIS